MKYRVAKYGMGQDPQVIAFKESLVRACRLARGLGAHGALIKYGPKTWCYDGEEKDSVNYWMISAVPDEYEEN